MKFAKEDVLATPIRNIEQLKRRYDLDKLSESSLKALKSSLLDFFYPIGTIYNTTDTSSPDDIFGGTWTQVSVGLSNDVYSWERTS